MKVQQEFMDKSAAKERREERSEAAKPYLTDILRPGLDVIFIGAAASLNSAREGHWYAGPTNKFYLLLHQAGFTPRQLRPEEDVDLPNFGIGLTCLHKFSASSANHLLPVPTSEQRQTVGTKIETFAPRFACCNGKDVFCMVTGQECLDWGEQAELMGSSRVFVVHSSSARADHWAADRLALYRELRSKILETTAR